jgi:hypothetical protein
VTVWTLLLDWSHRYTNYTIVITIWLNVTKYAYLKWQCTFNFLSLPIPLPDLTVYMSNTMVVLQETGTAYLSRAPVLSFLGCVVCVFFFCLRPVSYISNVTSFSGLFILPFLCIYSDRQPAMTDRITRPCLSWMNWPIILNMATDDGKLR